MTDATTISYIHLDINAVHRANADPRVRVGIDGVTKIVKRTENYGEYGIPWYDVFAGDVLEYSVAAKSVAIVAYQGEEG